MMQRLLSVVALGLMCTSSSLMPGTGLLRAGESADGQITFSGRVLDKQGKPVAGAKVTLHRLDIDESADALMKSERLGEKVTGSDGAFVFTASKSSGSYRLGSIIAQKEGFALGWVVWMMQEGSQQADIPLNEPKELSGVVVDEAGSPVGDAQVSIAIGLVGAMDDERFVTSLADPQLLTVKTDGRGRFAFANLPADATFEFFAQKPGRARICTFNPQTTSSAGKCQFASGRTDIKLTLPPEAKIEGKVVEKASGKPVGGVRITARLSQREDPFGNEPVTSGPDGTFSIAALAPGEYAVQLASKVQGAADWVAEPVQVAVRTGETVRDVRVALTGGCLVEVLVTEAGSGKPIENVRVGILDTARGEAQGGVTDATGVARMRVSPGSYQSMGIYHQDYEYLDQQEAFTIEDGQTKRFERVLGGLPSITGVVYDDAGKPLEGVELQIMPASRERTTSDAQGRFKATWDPRNWSRTPPAYYLFARHAQRNLAAAEPAGEAGTQMEVKLRPGVTLTGQVTDPNGKPIAGADIRVMFCGSNWRSTIMANRSVTTDAQGRYEVGAMPPEQRYDINASADNYGQARTEVDTAGTVGNRAQASTLTLPIANLSVSGVVVDSAGKPISGAYVSCYGDERNGQPNRDVRTDAEGKFTLDHVCAGQLDVSANGRAGAISLQGSVRTEGGAKDVQLVLTERSSGSTRYVPKTPASLKGKPLPEVKTLGIEMPADAEGKMLLVCFWDMNQRPSRYFVTQLAAQAAQLGEKGVVIVAVQAAKVEQNALAEWVKASKIPFAVGSVAGDAEKAQFDWGVASLPHLILTDKKHVVVADGFGLSDLDKRIEEASSR